MLQSLMGHFIRNEIDADDLSALACISTALACEDPAQLPKLLRRARDAGAPLEQLGALALVADRPLVARALREHFQIDIAHYLTTGGERGTQATDDYPLLVALTFMQEDELLERALHWGADPRAVWKVDTLMGTYKEEPATISWLSEATRSIMPDLVDKLLVSTSQTPLTDVEEDRCLIALWQAPLRNHNGSRDHDLRELVEMLGPGGTHALRRSFWDVSFEGGNLGQKVAASMLTGFNQSQRIMGLHLLEKWVKSTIPNDGKFQRDLLLNHFQVDRLQDFQAPAWCVDALSPAQAVDVLQAAYPAMLRHILGRYQPSEMRRSTEMLSQDFERCGKVLEPLTTKALQYANEPLASPMSLLGLIGENTFVCMAPGVMDQLVAIWPGDKAAAASQLQDLRTLLLRRCELSSLFDDTNAPNKEDTRLAIAETTAELRRLHHRTVLDAATPQRPAKASPRL